MTPTRDVGVYHEAGHALLALHLGVKLAWIHGGDTAHTSHEELSYAAASYHDRALITLAGGITEEIVFGERSRNCCTDDLEHVAEILAQAPAGVPAESLRVALESELREILRRPAFRSALEILAEELATHDVIAGPWAPELLWKTCPEIRPFLRVRPEHVDPA